MTRTVVAGFWDNLSPAENLELRTINAAIRDWVAYCEKCRTSKPRVPIDSTKDVPNDLYIRAYHLRTKFFQPFVGMKDDQIRERSGQSQDAPQVRF